MNNGTGTAPGSATPSLANLIKPEQVQTLLHFPEDQKPKYIQGVTKLWETLSSQQPDSSTYQQAYNKLKEVTQNVRKIMQSNREKSMAAPGSAQQAGGRPPNQPLPPANQAQPQGEMSQQQPKPEQFSAKVLQKLETLTVYVPPSILAQRGADAGPKYVNEMKKQFGQALQQYDRAEMQLAKLAGMLTQRNASGKPLTQQEQTQYDAQLLRSQTEKERSLDLMRKFQKQQDTFKAQLSQSNNGETGQNGQAMKQEGNTGVGNVAQAPEHQGQAHTVSSALDAARSQANNVPPGRPSATSPTKSNGQPQQTPTSQPPNAPQSQASQAAVNNVKNETQPHQNQPGIQAPHPTAPQQPGDPQPLRHEDALEKARSYSNGPAYPHNTPQSATHAHPPQHNQRESQANSHSKMPVPKDLPHVPPQPVSMGQSRPSLSNGPLPVGPIGQPNIHRNPGYVLEGDGERVLSKKKLEELVRQVTGGTGGEGEDGESITAEVEETLLNIADDFVDQVIASACKLAKLRSSSTLELRDIQLILERNYNIRVPGYASDELRTVKKIQPAPSWTQKLSAVNAAKVTGGKVE